MTWWLLDAFGFRGFWGSLVFFLCFLVVFEFGVCFFGEFGVLLCFI